MFDPPGPSPPVDSRIIRDILPSYVRNALLMIPLLVALALPVEVRAEADPVSGEATNSAATTAPFEPALLQGLGDVRYHRLSSEAIGRDFHIFVRLPEGYEYGAEKYPAVYLLDGGNTFPLLSGYYRYLNLGQEIPECILVGIAYGTDDWQQGNRRSTDFTAPSREREYWGGAGKFQQMLDGELLPLIERDYRSDPNRRIIFGQSLGGQFVLFSAQTRPSLFWGHIASNPALHRNLPFFLGTRPKTAAGARSRLFVSSGSNDEPRFRAPALEWIEHWSEQESLPWDLETTSLDGHGHFSAATAAFRQGLRWLFRPR